MVIGLQAYSSTLESGAHWLCAMDNQTWIDGLRDQNVKQRKPKKVPEIDNYIHIYVYSLSMNFSKSDGANWLISLSSMLIHDLPYWTLSD